MEKFSIVNIPPTISISKQNKVYSVIEIDVKTIAHSQKMQDTFGNEVQVSGGVYVFVLNKDINNFDIDFFNREVTGIFLKKGCPYMKICNVPQYNNKQLCVDHVFYVGKAGQVESRIKEHWLCDKLTSCTSLKLGFDSRKWIKEFLKLYLIQTSDDKEAKELEKAIREKYGSVFGK